MRDPCGRSITYLRLSVTELCNLRCRYCMPEQGVPKKRHEDMLTEEEMVRAVRAAASLGVWKVRVTGGEPLVKPNILSICRNISEVPGIRELCLTTNGTLLSRERAGALRDAGVRRVNISLDTLDPEKYRDITRLGSLEDALTGIEAALDAGFEKIKINTVLINGFNDDEIPALAGLTCRWPVDVRFIELMPMTLNYNEGRAYLSADEVLRRLSDALEINPAGPQTDGVAKLYRLRGARGNVGVIRTVSRRFCADCTRLRLTADGHLKPCLHTADEGSIKGMSENGMREAMLRAVAAKPEMRPEFTGPGRAMNQIGG